MMNIALSGDSVPTKSPRGRGRGRCIVAADPAFGWRGALPKVPKVPKVPQGAGNALGRFSPRFIFSLCS